MTKIEELEQKLNECQKALAEIQKEITELNELQIELKESKKEKWKPKDGEKFWFRNVGGESESYIHEDFFNSDEWLINNLPIFKTKEECERYWRFMDTVKEKSYSFSKEEWEDDEIDKLVIYYDYTRKEFGVTCTFCKYLGEIYFKDKESTQYIIDNFKDELMEYFL